MAYKPAYQTIVDPGAAPEYKQTAVAPAEYQLGTYDSKYGEQLQGALDKVVNWKYDPMNDANYQALAKVYGARGNQAAKNSLADAASLNGGYGTSYAVSAAQQARNQYNQELAALIPDLEATAYQRAQGTLGALRDADDTDYGRYRDTEGDRQWQWTQNYNAYRDTVGDEQGLYSQNYQRYQDALSQYQWALDYNNALYAQQAKSSGGGGGGRRRSGGGGYVGGGVTVTNPAAPVAAPTYKFRAALGGINTTNKYDTKKNEKKGYYAGPQK